MQKLYKYVKVSYDIFIPPYTIKYKLLFLFLIKCRAGVANANQACIVRSGERNKMRGRRYTEYMGYLFVVFQSMSSLR